MTKIRSIIIIISIIMQRLTRRESQAQINSNCPIHTAAPDTTQTGRFCRVWRVV